MEYSIKHELGTQDIRMTSYPMFCVCHYYEHGSGQKIMITDNVFFTSYGANQFIRNEIHNYDEDQQPFVYIKSGHNNPEWKLALKILKEGKTNG